MEPTKGFDPFLSLKPFELLSDIVTIITSTEKVDINFRILIDVAKKKLYNRIHGEGVETLKCFVGKRLLKSRHRM